MLALKPSECNETFWADAWLADGLIGSVFAKIDRAERSIWPSERQAKGGDSYGATFRLATW
jgi:hypothetical protein